MRELAVVANWSMQAHLNTRTLLSKTKKNPNIMPSLVNLAPTFIIYHGHLYFIHCEKNYVTLVITAWSHRLLIDQENTDSRAPTRPQIVIPWQVWITACLTAKKETPTCIVVPAKLSGGYERRLLYKNRGLPASEQGYKGPGWPLIALAYM
jgi:hypothetical protein